LDQRVLQLYKWLTLSHTVSRDHAILQLYVCTVIIIYLYNSAALTREICRRRAMLARCANNTRRLFTESAGHKQTWASAHRGKWGQLTPWKNGWKIKKRKHAKNSSFLCLCYILRAMRVGRCRERRYADHIFIQIYCRMHYFVVKFQNFLRLRRQGGIDPPNQKSSGRSWLLTSVLCNIFNNNS